MTVRARALAGPGILFAAAIVACGHQGAAPARPAPVASASPIASPPAPSPDAPRGRPARDAGALFALDETQACALPVTARGSTRDEAKPFARPDGTCPEPFCDTVEEPPRGGGACFVAASSLRRAEQAVRSGAGARAPVKSAPWDGIARPQYLDRVDAHLHLTPGEHEMLRANGFVALDRHRYDSYAVAFHDVFQQQLPVYVGVDAIFNAVYQSTQSLLGQVEDRTLGPALARILDRLPRTLAASGGRYDAETTGDLEVYLGVAYRLLHGAGASAPVIADPEREELVATLTESASQATGLEAVTLFGRERMIDFSQLTPRGHYASNEYGAGFDWPKLPPGASLGAVTEHIAPSAYFQAMMWLSRLELNVVSRSCRSSQPGAVADPSETPREARDAIALADLVARAGVLPDLARFDEVYGVFAGHREDLSLPALAALAARSGAGPRDPDAPAKLKAAIGTAYARTARTHFMPEDATTLPVITTMFGPRIVPDIAPLTGVVHPAVGQRFVAGAADVGYLLGHDRARAYLAADLDAFPSLGSALDAGRASLVAQTKGRRDVYATWLAATLRLADPPAGVVPSFMRTPAYADQRLGSALAAYAQIRHTFVLLAGQGYDAYGCEIPDGYVEPAVGVYDALLAWVTAAQAAVPSEAKYFRRVRSVLDMLRAISRTELSGAPLAEPQRRWLAMVSEYTPTGGFAGDSGQPPKWTGWYFDLFPDREHGAERGVGLVADYLTLTNVDRAAHLGIESAVLGAFVVDVDGAPRVMVGPVARTYEVSTPIAGRLDDERARTVSGKTAAWQTSFLAPAPVEADVAARLFVCADGARVVLQAGEPLDVEVSLLDHHGDALGAPTLARASTSPSAVAIVVSSEMATAPRGLEGVHLAVKRGATARWDLVHGPGVYVTDADAARRVAPGPGSRLDMAFGAMRPAAE